MRRSAARAYRPYMRRRRSCGLLVIEIADVERVEMRIELLLVLRRVLRDERERFAIRPPRELIDAVVDLRRLERVAAAERHDEDLRLRVAGRACVRDERKPVAGR